MPQKPLVYVSRITNLSDARYCAGMAVDMLGFVVDPADQDYVSPTRYQEIVGWVAGPKRVIEIAGALDNDPVKLVTEYAPDLVHLSLVNAGKFNFPHSISIILELSYGQWQERKSVIQKLGGRVEYLLVTEIPDTLSILQDDHSILLSLDKAAAPAPLLQQTGAHGFALQGSSELSPGLKDYDHLSRILEELEGDVIG